MAFADDLTRLSQEIVNAYEERVQTISAIKQNTTDLLNCFRKVHKEMADDLRAELAKVKSDLDAAEDERKKTDQAEVNQRRQDIERLLHEFDKVHKEMADDLRAELAKVKPDLESAESERKAADQAEIRAAAAAWKELLTTMQSTRERVVITGVPEVEEAVEVKPVEEVVEKTIEEEEEEVEVEEKEGLKEGIMDVLEEHPEGLKMTQIADILSIGNWRSLIPIMRELVDMDEVRKEDTVYYYNR